MEDDTLFDDEQYNDKPEKNQDLTITTTFVLSGIIKFSLTKENCMLKTSTISSPHVKSPKNIKRSCPAPSWIKQKNSDFRRTSALDRLYLPCVHEPVFEARSRHWYFKESRLKKKPRSIKQNQVFSIETAYLRLFAKGRYLFFKKIQTQLIQGHQK